ncbi:MFS transporter [Massilibacteroides vaginae]|uniref:MFS transporter n=1 Tax=Massilibacteroides vaginae TaxID=1673718 RepID=UPI000A1CBC27|nr:MFS transporter [Massilibacteroides vaginae]
MKDWKRVFTIIWAGQFVSILTSTIVGYAIVLWLSFETRSAEVLALGSVAAFLPQALIGPFAGVYVDRWDRKKTMIAADVFIALCTLILAVIFMLGKIEIWYIYLLLVLRSVGSAFHSPAMQASVPLLAPEEELGRIAGINQMIQSVSVIAGPAIAALLISIMDIGFILFFDIVGAAIACVSLLFVYIPNPKKEADNKQHVLREMKEGLKTITANKGLRYLGLFFVLAMVCIMPIGALFPLMTLNHFNGTAFQIGLVEVFWGVGMLIGGAIMGLNKRYYNKAAAINLIYLIVGTVFSISGLLPAEGGYVFFVVLTFFSGIGGSIQSACFTTIIQEKVDPGQLGRVFSMFMSVAVLPSMIGLLGTGFAADTIGIPNTFIILGCCIFVLGVVSFMIPSLMALGRRE